MGFMTLLGDHAPFYDLLIHVSLIVALGTYIPHTLTIGRRIFDTSLYLSSGGFKQYQFRFITSCPMQVTVSAVFTFTICFLKAKDNINMDRIALFPIIQSSTPNKQAM
ncbi:hypothetical protein BDV33DRAFT_134981 [Aspergillus novoparasiticus]|uniref:Uncharacterized protein n=1 Tax=Aspergillus novoparasiticus TaxID=986946 RepID=A0A5N6F7S8_9EURO|nr:hypothetical protein BDV33DRAFT_134981 [Aspergillus novoparasiticus]